jgi:amino acid transporter
VRFVEASIMRSLKEDKSPLLDPDPAENRGLFTYGSLVHEHQEEQHRSLEDDVIPETAIYGRNLTWASAYIMVISRVIGTGIFATPGIILKSVGSVGLAISLWIIGAGISATGLVVWLEYGCMLPRSGGDKVYLEFTYRRPRFLASTLIAAQAVLLTFTTGNCVVFGEYMLFALDIVPTDLSRKMLAAALLTVIVIGHGCFLKTGIWIQNILGWIKVFLVIFMALTGLYVVIFRQEIAVDRPPRTNVLAWSVLWKGSNWGWAALSTAMLKVNFAYAGLNNLNSVLNEVKDPVRTLKSVGPAALATSCILYLLANIAYFCVVPIEEVKGSDSLIAALFFGRLFGAGLGKTILPLAIAISAAGNVMVVTFTTVWWLPVCLTIPAHDSYKRVIVGSHQSGDCPARLLAILTPSLLLTSIQRATRRSCCTLHPVSARHPAASI